MRKYFAITGFFIAISLYAYPQADIYAFNQEGVGDKIDRLKKELPALKDSARIDCLNDLSESYLTFNTDTARVYARQALKEAEKTGYVKGQAKGYRNLGRIECRLVTDLPAAEKYFSQSLGLFIKTKDDQQIAWAWGALGLSKWVLSKFPEAMSAFEKAEQLFKKVGDTIDLVGTYEFMSRAEFESGKYAKSLEYAFKRKDLTGKEDYFILSQLYTAIGDDETAEKYRQRIPMNNSDYRKYAYLGTGISFLHKNQYDSALHYFLLFSYYAKTAGAGPLIKLYESLGELHLALKHYDSTLVFLNRALNMSTKANDRNQVMKVYLILGKTYQASGKYEKALENARVLSQVANETGAKQNIRDAHLLLYQVFDHLHKHDSALAHLKKYVAVKDSIDLDLSAQKLAFYLIRSEREKAETDVKFLNEKSRLQQQQLKQTALQKTFLLAGITALLIIGVLLFRNILLQRKSEKDRRKLAERELKMQKLESERKEAALQQQASELEMQALRAQMNPHFIFNCLNAINGFILINESETASDYLTKFSRLVRMVLNNSQKKLISLDEEVESLGLYLHMESLRFNFHYRVKCDDTIDALCVFIPPMLLQPFAENAIWHGLMHKNGQGELLIDLHLENDMLHCTIADNGVGRKKAYLLKSKSAVKNKSMGLQITNSRMALLSRDSNDHCFFKINDLEDEWGNATGTSVSIKIKIKGISADNIPNNMFHRNNNK
ncbi:MAG: histidine kinase [Ginsengibacter sp.]